MMNCAARAAIALMDKSQAAAHTQYYSFCSARVRIQAESERENSVCSVYNQHLCAVYVCWAALHLSCRRARQKSLFAPWYNLYTHTDTRTQFAMQARPRRTHTSAQGVWNSCMAEKNFGSQRREREEGKSERGRLTDTSASPKTLSLLSLSSSFLAIYFPDMLFRVLK